jgi:hypothetical protein
MKLVKETDRTGVSMIISNHLLASVNLMLELILHSY